MGIEPFLVASSVNLICAQRLVRCICGDCAEPEPMPIKALVDIGFGEDVAGDIEPKRGRGCDRCRNTGYRGRIGLFEVMEVSDALRELILVGASSIELRRKAAEGPGRGDVDAATERTPQDRRWCHDSPGGHTGDHALIPRFTRMGEWTADWAGWRACATPIGRSVTGPITVTERLRKS